MIKLIAADMDGTLLNEHSQLNGEFFEIFKKLNEKGILFVAASGRQYYTLRDNFSGVQDEIAYAAENGSYVLYKGSELFSDTLPLEDVKELLKVGRQLEGAEIVLCGKKSAYIESKSRELLQEVEKYYFRHEVVESLDDIEDEFLKFTICDFIGSAENSNKIIEPLWGNRLKVTVSGQIWLDVNSSTANKGTAIKKLQEKFGIKPEETMAFGDYFNDIEMLSSAYYSYAMENAPEEVKKQARFIAKSNRDNGVLEVIKEIL